MIFLLILGVFVLSYSASCQSNDLSKGLSIPPSYMQGSPALPSEFSSDWYWVTGGPNLRASLERSSIYRNENTSLFLTLSNIGRITSFKVLEQPDSNRRDEVLAAQKELQMESLRSTAQDITIRLVPVNVSALNLKREVAYAGSLKEGQVSQRLEFPIEVYEKTEPGEYRLNAIANYTYQRDVAVKPHSDSPDNPDVFYLYDNATQTIPLTLHIEKRSLVDLKALNVSPHALDAGSKNNDLKIVIQNQGNDTAKDLVAKLRPETGVYVDMDESPIQSLRPGQKAELIYKVDISKDAIEGKLYRFTLLFDYSDSYRKNLHDSDNVYIFIQSGLAARYWWAAIAAVAIMALIVFFWMRSRRKAVA